MGIATWLLMSADPIGTTSEPLTNDFRNEGGQDYCCRRCYPQLSLSGWQARVDHVVAQRLSLDGLWFAHDYSAAAGKGEGSKLSPTLGSIRDRFLTVLQSPFLQFPSFGIHKGNFLDARV